MKRFLEILREELERALSIGGSYANKVSMMATYDKAVASALIRYHDEVDSTRN